MLTQSQYGTVKDEADIYLKSYLQEFNRNDTPLVTNIFRMYHNANIYRDREQGLDVEMQGSEGAYD